LLLFLPYLYFPLPVCFIGFAPFYIVYADLQS
jgi:hypothetical protein